MPSDVDTQINEAIQVLSVIADDNSVPRNIRKSATKSIDILQNQDMDLQLRATSAIEILDETTTDPNCPFHARTMLWQAITRLEIPV